MLKRHLVFSLCGRDVFHVNATWSLIKMGCIIESEMFNIIELPVRKKLIHENDL